MKTRGRCINFIIMMEILIGIFNFQARSKLPKKRRRVLPVEQPRRKKKEEGLTNRRMNAIKHHHPAFGNAKLGRYAICYEMATTLSLLQ